MKALRDGLIGFGRVIVSQCLLACERSNVVVVAPASEKREGGAKPVWLSDMLTDDQTDALIDWIRAGGPGCAAVPALLAPYVGDRPRFCAGPPADWPADVEDHRGITTAGLAERSADLSVRQTHDTPTATHAAAR